MSCFKKDGSLRKVYTEFVPLIENAHFHHTVITSGRYEDFVEEYDCYRFEVPHKRYKYLVSLLDEIKADYHLWFEVGYYLPVHIDIKNYDEVLNIVRQANKSI